MSIITGDCLDVMKTFPDNHFSAIVTDPPYGLHFMGKDWDKFNKCKYDESGDFKNLPQYQRAGVRRIGSANACSGTYDPKRDDEFERFMFDTATAALRILKPGGHVLMFGAPRRYHRQVCALEDAGFEIRDCLMWIFGSGFPKSHNRFGIDGFGTALKPAYEPIIMAMKPCDGTFKQNAEKWGQAGINIDQCRVGDEMVKTCAKVKGQSFTHLGDGEGFEGCPSSLHKGRWPANVILDERASEQLGEPSRFFYCAKTSSKERNEGLGHMPLREAEFTCRLGNDPSKGLHNQPKQNSHPTVKPLKLMEYLINLVMPPKDGLLLDPFAGSGSTILAAKRLGFDAIGIEKQPEYAEIARARVANYASEENEGQLSFA